MFDAFQKSTPMSQGYFSLVLHAHLPFVRHPEHEKFLEESWLFEAVTETYLPLVQMLAGWRRDQLDAKITLSLSPTLCAMLQDDLLRRRYEKHLDSLIELAEIGEQGAQWNLILDRSRGLRPCPPRLERRG